MAHDADNDETPADAERITRLGPPHGLVSQIVVVASSGMRDAIALGSGLAQIRHAYPDARVAVVTADAGVGAVAAYGSGITIVDADDELHVRDVLSADATFVVDLREPSETDEARTYANARWVAAFRHLRDSKTHDVHPVFPHRMPREGAMARMAWLVSGGTMLPANRWLRWVGTADRQRAGGFLESVDRPLAAVHIGPADGVRSIPPGHLARACDSVTRMGMQVALIGTSDERGRAVEISAMADSSTIDLVGVTTVPELAGVLERASLMVGADTGPALLARALGVRTLVIGMHRAADEMGEADTVRFLAAGPDNDGIFGPASDVSAAEILAEVTFLGQAAVRDWHRQDPRNA